MLSKKHLSKIDSLTEANTLLRVGFIVLGVVACFSLALAYNSRHHVKTIITPRNLNTSYEVSENWMDDRGIKAFSRDTLDLLLNYNKGTAGDRFYDLLTMVLLGKYSKLKQELEDELKTIERLNVVSFYLPESYTIDRKENIISVVGLRRKESGGKPIFNGAERWNIFFVIKESTFKIVSITKSTNLAKVEYAK